MPSALRINWMLQPKRRAPNPRRRQGDGKKSKPVCRGTRMMPQAAFNFRSSTSWTRRLRPLLRSTSAAQEDGRSSLRGSRPTAGHASPTPGDVTGLTSRCAHSTQCVAHGRARGWYLIPPDPLTLEFPENREFNREFAKTGSSSGECGGPMAANIGVFERASASWHQGIRAHRTGNGSQVSGCGRLIGKRRVFCTLVLI